MGGARKLHWVLGPCRVPPLGDPLVKGRVHLGPVEAALSIMVKRPAHWQGEEGMAVWAWAHANGPTRLQPVPFNVDDRCSGPTLPGRLLGLGSVHSRLGRLSRLQRPRLDTVWSQLGVRRLCHRRR